MASTKLNLGTQTQDILAAANGGTGLSSYVKGDLIVATGTATLVNLGVGANTFVLTADSTQASGVRWASLPTATVSVYSEIPTGLINGANTSYTLANTPTAGTERIYLNGLRLYVGAGNDYTISGGTITMLAAPQTGDRLVVDYDR